MKSNKVFLYITSYRGISFGAVHYYGSLTSYDPDYKNVEVMKIMSEEEAKICNLNDKYDSYEAGDETIRFNSEEELKLRAIEIWKTIFPKGEVLFCGSICDADPCEILIAPEPYKELGNELWKSAELIDYYKNHPEIMEKISNTWAFMMKLIDKQCELEYCK